MLLNQDQHNFTKVNAPTLESNSANTYINVNIPTFICYVGNNIQLCGKEVFSQTDYIDTKPNCFKCMIL